MIPNGSNRYPTQSHNTYRQATIHNIPRTVPPSNDNNCNRIVSPGSYSNFSNLHNDKITSIIQNWGLKFDGTSTGLTVEEFLYRLKTLTNDNFQGDFNIICKNLHMLLTGKARDWFWRYHKQVEVVNWEDFNEAIRLQYKEFKSSFDIREEIRNRKQKSGESFDMYYEALSSIMDRLPSPLSEMELIEIITRIIIYTSSFYSPPKKTSPDERKFLE